MPGREPPRRAPAQAGPQVIIVTLSDGAPRGGSHGR